MILRLKDFQVEKTKENRPDLLENKIKNDEEFKKEYKKLMKK